MTTIVQTENPSRRSFVRAATLSAIAAIPAVAALSRAGLAGATPLCEQLSCSCADCYGSCGGHPFICKAICFDQYTGACCGLYCPGDAPEVPGCGYAGTNCHNVSCGGGGC